MALTTSYIVGNDIKDGHYWRAAENAMPKFARDWMKSARYANEGVVTRRGDDLVPDVGIMGILSQAAGFTPAEVAERYQINNRLYNKQERILDQRRRLHKAAGDAVLSGRGIPDSVIRKIQAFNAEYPEKPITEDTLRQSIRARQQGTARREFGIALDPKLNARLRGEMAGMIYR